MAVKNKSFIGCSGYYYPNWKNKFYPEKLSSSKWLQHYSSVFGSVELNGTFYRVPKVSDLKRQAGNTPEDFKFSVKMSRYVTHILRLKNASQQIKEFTEIVNEGLSGKLHKILFQMPPSFHFNEENAMALRDAGLGKQNVIEFRHTSWWNEETIKILREKKCTFCNVDFPGMDTNFMHSTKEFYLRLHGNPVLFKSSYSESELKRFYELVPENAWPRAVYFNNTYYGAAYENAALFMELAGHSR
jgi:uncharacterized protein YecE (DUF72 family)